MAISDTVKLSTIHPDQVDIRTQLESILLTNKVWKDLIPAETGEILIKFIAGVGATNQYTIERAVQECFLETAKSPQNILTITRLLGVRIKRASPNKVKMNVTVPLGENTLNYGKYTQFTIDGQYKFYNKEPIVVRPGTTQSIELTEGELVIHQYTSDGTAFQQYLIGDSFTSSDDECRVFINGNEWERMTSGIWKAENEQNVFSDQTTQIGSMEITFGNTVNGTIPPINSSIVIHEYIVSGTTTLDERSELEVKCDSDNQFKAKTTTIITGGDSAPTSNFYQLIGARLGRAGERFVTRSDYSAGLLAYPGVIASTVKGEHEFNPPNLNMMNIIRMYLLTTHEWSEDEEAEFMKWLEQYCMLGCKHILEPVEAIPLKIVSKVLISTGYTTEDVRERVTNALRAKYALTDSSLEKPAYRSDIHQTIMNVTGVLHNVLEEPTTDITLEFAQYLSLDVEDGGIELTVDYA